MLMKTYVLNNGKTLDGIAKAIENAYDKQKEMQHIKLEDGSIVIQLRDEAFLRMAGLDEAVTIRIVPVGQHNVSVEVGQGKWLGTVMRKLATSVILTFFVGPMIFALRGADALGQYRLPRDVLAIVDRYLGVEANAAA